MHTNRQTTSWFDCDFRWCGNFRLFLLNFPPQIYVNYAFTTHAGKVLSKVESSEVIFLFHFLWRFRELTVSQAVSRQRRWISPADPRWSSTKPTGYSTATMQQRQVQSNRSERIEPASTICRRCRSGSAGPSRGSTRIPWVCFALCLRRTSRRRRTHRRRMSNLCRRRTQPQRDRSLLCPCLPFMDCARELHSAKENTRSILKETEIESCKIRIANAHRECRERERREKLRVFVWVWLRKGRDA